jgi:hypothetical protein
VVHTPYTAFFGDAFMAAHIAIGVMLIALTWWLFPKTSGARLLFIGAILLVTTAPLLPDFVRGLGAKTPPVRIQQVALLLSSCLVVLAVLSLRRFVLVVVACAMTWLLVKMPDWLDDSMTEICALHAIWIGVALGLVRRRAPMDQAEGADTSSYGDHDVFIFIAAMLAAVVASIFVLQRADGSADEWAYTWQASVFAKAHIYGSVPPCDTAFQNFYVFESVGKLFVQYTPGWPYFMTPFAFFGVPWLAGPASHGLMAVGVARVARSAVRLDGRATRARVSAAGLLAAGVATFGTTILLVGASRYSHVFVAALFAWAIESVLVLRTPNLSRDRQVRWGLVFGSVVALMGATRPADGATLSVGLFFYFVYCLVRRRIGLRAFIATCAGFFFWGGLTLLILRIQLGTWFTTGYSLDKIIHPWAVAKYSWPRPSEWKFSMPLATGSYAWFPCSLALGFAGLMSLRRAASGIITMMMVGFVCFDAYYQSIDLGRGFDWGYGPRYSVPFAVLMAVGTGVALAPLAENARRRAHAHSALYAGGPFAIVLCTMVVTVIRLWPLLYPGIYQHVQKHDSLNARIREMGIHHAVVMTQIGATGFDVLDLTENLPLDLYPNQDVLIAIERNPDSTRCVRQAFPTRAIYRATGSPVVISNY